MSNLQLGAVLQHLRRTAARKQDDELSDGNGVLMRTFHDELPETAAQVLELLGVDGTAYGLT
jgi:hypothetical protein